jgi:IclR family pca regulon transcriptional regulator
MTLADAARELHATRASARRTLLTLEGLGYLRLDDRHYTLTPKVLSLGHGYRRASRCPRSRALTSSG